MTEIVPSSNYKEKAFGDFCGSWAFHLSVNIQRISYKFIKYRKSLTKYIR